MLCRHPSFFTQTALCASIAISLMAQMNYIAKSCVFLLVHLFYCSLPFGILKDEYTQFDADFDAARYARRITLITALINLVHRTRLRVLISK
jgi:hypothetical protein